jgi:D-sedoheptulose 7-phosphate isomerase
VNYFAELSQTVAALDTDKLDALRRLVATCTGTVWIAGNGGSAATAQHWACDLSKAAGRCVMALGANSAVLTAWANDTSYAAVFAAELKRLARPDDCLICISCSGVSPNITHALRQAWLLKIKRALVMGPTRPIVTPVDVLINVPHPHYGIIEDCHLAIGHWLTEELRDVHATDA